MNFDCSTPSIDPSVVTHIKKIDMNNYYKQRAGLDYVHCQICLSDIPKINLFKHTVSKRHKYNKLLVAIMQDCSCNVDMDFVIEYFDILKCRYCDTVIKLCESKDQFNNHVHDPDHIKKRDHCLNGEAVLTSEYNLLRRLDSLIMHDKIYRKRIKHKKKMLELESPKNENELARDKIKKVVQSLNSVTVNSQQMQQTLKKVKAASDEIAKVVQNSNSVTVNSEKMQQTLKKVKAASDKIAEVVQNSNSVTVNSQNMQQTLEKVKAASDKIAELVQNSNSVTVNSQNMQQTLKKVKAASDKIAKVVQNSNSVTVNSQNMQQTLKKLKAASDKIAEVVQNSNSVTVNSQNMQQTLEKVKAASDKIAEVVQNSNSVTVNSQNMQQTLKKVKAASDKIAKVVQNSNSVTVNSQNMQQTLKKVKAASDKIAKVVQNSNSVTVNSQKMQQTLKKLKAASGKIGKVVQNSNNVCKFDQNHAPPSISVSSDESLQTIYTFPKCSFVSEEAASIYTIRVPNIPKNTDNGNDHVDGKVQKKEMLDCNESIKNKLSSESITAQSTYDYMCTICMKMVPNNQHNIQMHNQGTKHKKKMLELENPKNERELLNCIESIQSIFCV